MLQNLPRRLFRRALSPSRRDKVYRKYDFGRGYREYHERCKAQFTRAVVDQPCSLVTEGYEFLRVTSKEVASKWVDTAFERFQLEAFRKNEKFVEFFRIDDPQFTSNLLETVFTEEVDDRIVRFFESEYFVHWVVVTRALPVEGNARNSFLWHCDRGPRAHLKLLVYLNDAQEHGGSTQFINLRDTEAIGDTGYLFGPVRERRADLSELARQAGAEFRPQGRPFEAGEAVLFQPANNLHSGIAPSRGPRYVASLCLLPSPLNWREALLREPGWDMTQGEKWHADATQLFRN
jgi:hypothetical protein